MRRFIYGTLLAALAMFSACDALQPQEDLLPEDVTVSEKYDTVVLSASLGADTRTDLVWSDETQSFKTVWEENDYIYVFDEKDWKWNRFVLIEGAGTPNAKFKGSISEQYRYTAVYPESFYGDQYNVGFILNDTQYDFCSPMVACSYDTNLNFINVCSVLCVRLTGNGESVSSVTFKPHEGNPGAGQFEVYFDNNRPLVGWRNSDARPITMNVDNEILGSTPREYYFVIPYGEYLGGFDIFVQTEQGKMKRSTTEDIFFERSQVRCVNLEWDEDYLMEWGLIGEMTNWDSDIMMSKEGDYWVLKGQYLDAGVQFKFRYGGDWLVNLGAYPYSDPYELKFDVGESLLESGPNMYVTESGVYDIYLDVDNKVVYIMHEGQYPQGDIPEKPESSWGLVGSMTYWDYDIDMTNEDGLFVLRDQYLEDGDELKFRANDDWAINLGLDAVLPINGTIEGLYQGGSNIKVEHTGYYNFYLDVEAGILRTEFRSE